MAGIMDGQLDWGGKGGKLWECWVVQPCCDIYCCLTWYFCGCFNSCHMFAWALGQKCAIVQHCLPLTFLPMCCFYRFAVREKVGVKAGGPMEGLIGDLLCAWCCGWCACCQELRGAHISGGKGSWDYFGTISLEVSAGDCKSFPPFTKKGSAPF